MPQPTTRANRALLLRWVDLALQRLDARELRGELVDVGVGVRADALAIQYSISAR